MDDQILVTTIVILILHTQKLDLHKSKLAVRPFEKEYMNAATFGVPSSQREGGGGGVASGHTPTLSHSQTTFRGGGGSGGSQEGGGGGFIP